MLCLNCSKLAYLHTKRVCIRCQGEVLNNISVLCEFCSKTDNVCAVCIKKIPTATDKKNIGCGPCSAKQR